MHKNKLYMHCVLSKGTILVGNDPNTDSNWIKSEFLKGWVMIQSESLEKNSISVDKIINEVCLT